MKLTFSLTALPISKTFLFFQCNCFSTAEIRSEAKISIVSNVELATYYISKREYSIQYEVSKIKNVLRRSLKNAPGSDPYVLV